MQYPDLVFCVKCVFYFLHLFCQVFFSNYEEHARYHPHPAVSLISFSQFKIPNKNVQWKQGAPHYFLGGHNVKHMFLQFQVKSDSLFCSQLNFACKGYKLCKVEAQSPSLFSCTFSKPVSVPAHCQLCFRQFTK